MRVLTVVFGLSKGGTERAATNFAIQYASLGHDSRLLYTRHSGPREDALRSMGIPIYSLLDASDVQEIAAWGPELVHLHSSGISGGAFNYLRSSWGDRKPRIVETNVFSVPSPWEGLLNVSFQMSEWGRWQYAARGGDSRIARVVGYPVERSFGMSFEKRDSKKSLGIDPGTKVVGRVGQAYPRKWSRNYLDALEKHAKREKLVFLSVAAPPSLNKAIAQIPRVTLAPIDQVSSDEELSKLYSAMDVMLHVADQGESFGYSLVEAGLLGVPVVTLATPWADNAQAEIVTEETGLVVARRSSLSSALRHAERPWDRELMVEKILGRFESRAITQKALLTVDESRSEPLPAPTLPSYMTWDRGLVKPNFWSKIPKGIAWKIRGEREA